MILLTLQNEIQTLYYWGAAFVGLTILIAVLEIFIPSGGILMLISICSALASLVAFFLADTKSGIIALLSYTFFTPVAVWVGFKIWLSSSLSRKMILTEDVAGKSISKKELTKNLKINEELTENKNKILKKLIGKTGVTDGVLRPVGTIYVDNERISAISERGFINSGVEVEIVDAYDNQLKVRTVNSVKKNNSGKIE